VQPPVARLPQGEEQQAINHLDQHREYEARLREHGGAKDTAEKEPEVCRKCHLRLAIKTDGDSVPICEPCALGKTKPIVRQSRKIGRNEPYPCGSGKKFKVCHLRAVKR
jgi:uncharacterized protein YchJ